MGYREAADRIGLALEAAIPEIRRHVPPGVDFRPGNHGEVIVSGVHVKMPPSDIFPEPNGIEEDSPVQFKVLFGGMEKCKAAYTALIEKGIHPEVVPPHNTVLVCDGEELPTRVGTWRLMWELPQDYQIA